MDYKKAYPKVDDLFIFLVKSGFSYARPKCKTWHSAFFLVKGKEALCILLRTNGIDFRVYNDYTNELRVEDNQLFMTGGKILRNYYRGAQVWLIGKAAIVGKLFADNKLLSEIEILDREVGYSYKDSINAELFRKATAKGYAKKRAAIRQKAKDDRDWRGIVSYVNEECGGYWGNDF